MNDHELDGHLDRGLGVSGRRGDLRDGHGRFADEIENPAELGHGVTSSIFTD